MKTLYKYSLRKLELDKKRFRVKSCPCGKNNKDGKFVPYVGFENKGYCHSCGETFLPELPKAEQCNSYQAKTYKPKAVTAQQKPIMSRKASYHGLELLEKMFANESIEDNLTAYLYDKFSYLEVQKAINSYFITGTKFFWNNATVFWQIDEKECLHAGKIMLYNASNGRRIKDPYNHINWMHKALKTPDFNLSQCLFGLHRIKENYTRTIAITESEKTAIILSILLSNFIWLATGSKQNLNRKMLKPIKNRNIVLYADKGEFENWNNKALELNANGYKIAVSDLLEYTDLSDGSDLADYIIKS